MLTFALLTVAVLLCRVADTRQEADRSGQGGNAERARYRARKNQRRHFFRPEERSRWRFEEHERHFHLVDDQGVDQDGLARFVSLA